MLAAVIVQGILNLVIGWKVGFLWCDMRRAKIAVAKLNGRVNYNRVHCDVHAMDKWAHGMGPVAPKKR